jgi:hypothetical protein
MLDDPLSIVIGLVLSTTAFIGMLFGTIWLTRRRLAPPLLSTTLMAVAAASLPWILRAVGATWSVDSGLVFSAIIGTLIFAARFGLIETSIGLHVTFANAD